MKPKDWGTTDIRLTKALSLNVEWTYYAEDVSADRDVPSDPAIYEIETVWLFEEITESIIDASSKKFSQVSLQQWLPNPAPKHNILID